MQKEIESINKQQKLFKRISICAAFYSLAVLIVMLIQFSDSHIQMVISDLMQSIFGLSALILSTVTFVRFCKLKRQKNTINFHRGTLIICLLFNLSFVATEILSFLMHIENEKLYKNRGDDLNPMNADEYDRLMTRLNTRYLIYIIVRTILYVCLSILTYNLYLNIEKFTPDSKKVKIEEVLEKYEDD